MANNVIITIARQHGSGGGEIGRRLGELLDIKVYDNELLTMAAEKKGLPEEYLRRVDERATGSLLYSIAMSAPYAHGIHAGAEMSINDRLFVAQAQIIREIAEGGSAIFIGRCADYVLRNNLNCINIFLQADGEVRVARICERTGCSKREAESVMQKTDKRRASYYNYHTGGKWGRVDRYHLVLDTGLLGVEGTAKLIAEAVKLRAR